MKHIYRIGKQFLICLISILTLAPVIFTVAGSFVSEQAIGIHFGGLFDYTLSWRPLSIPEFFREFSPEQYRAVLLLSPDYLFRLWRSLSLTVPIVVFQLLLSVPAAYAFSQTRQKKMSALFFLYLFVLLLPVQVTVIPNYLMAKRLGLVETDWSIWLPGIASPFGVYLLTRSMNRVPAELFEAARTDGAGEGRILVRIALPLCKGQVTVCAVLLFAEYWNMVELPAVMFSQELSYPLSVFLSRIEEGEVGIAFAASVLYMIPAVLVFLFGEDYLLDAGAVKW